MWLQNIMGGLRNIAMNPAEQMVAKNFSEIIAENVQIYSLKGDHIESVSINAPIIIKMVSAK